MRCSVLLMGWLALLAGCSQSASRVVTETGGQSSREVGGESSTQTSSNTSTGGQSKTTGGTQGSTGGTRTQVATGGTLAETGGARTSAGGASATGGSQSAAGGTRTSAAGGASATGGTRASTGGTRAGVGGASATGGTKAATGGSSAAGGSEQGGTRSTVSSAATGGASDACSDQPGSLKPTYAFPQNYRSAKCVYPTGACSKDARAAYEEWKQKLVVTDGAGGFQRVNRPDTEAGLANSTVSEGIAYGMILAVFMDDQTLFDNLWQYSQLHLNGKGLMIWIIDPSGNPANESSGQPASGSATDADEDMAWALALAAQKWGTSPTLGAYKPIAVHLMGLVYANEADTRYDLFNAGDSWGTTFAWNPSYFAPYEYRVFAKLDTEHAAGWNKLIDKGYQVLAASQQASGLVPAWTDASGKPAAAWSGGPTQYQYDAVRVPFRVGIDYCEYGEPRALPILQKFSTFFSGIGADKIVDGYALDGTPQPENTSPEGVQSALFVGAAGVAAMSSTSNSAFVNAVYQRLVTQPDEMMLPVSRYYNRSWKVFTLLMMSGNLFEYSLHP